MNLDKTLEIFGKTKDNLQKIADDNNYNKFIFDAAIKKLEETKRGFENWNQLVDFFMIEGHTIRSEFSANPEKFIKRGLFK